MTLFVTYMKPVLDCLTAIGTLIALAALVVTVIKNRRDENARQQQELLEQCKRTLEWSYNVLMPDPNAKSPEANRLNWLTASRHIVAYQKLKTLITLQPHVRILEDFEEFWRHRFYLALSDTALSTYHFWAKPDPIIVNIDSTSALIVVDFSGWPQGKQDPVELSDQDKALLMARNGLKGNAGRGLNQYIRLIQEKFGPGSKG